MKVPVIGGGIGVLVSFIGLARSIARLGRELQARRAILYLGSLDDQQLRDLGLKRRDIERFVRSRQGR